MFAFLGQFLMPAPLTLGWSPKGRTAGREGHTGEREGCPGTQSGTRLEVRLWLPLLHSPGMVVGRAGQDPLHFFSLADQGTSKTRPGLRETKRLQKKPVENVFARVTLL